MLTKKENTKSELKTSKNAKTPSSTETYPHDTHKECCSPFTKTSTQQDSKTTSPYTKQTTKSSSETHCTNQKTSSHSKTRLTIKYDAGFPNQLYIRGKGANLSWDKGQPLKNVKPDEWIWETDAHFTNCEFKILINDHIYEDGDNHYLNAGSTLLYTPHFYSK